MTQALALLAGDDGRCGAGGRPVVVGVKLDVQSRELLTWALVKLAQPGDLVIALHVLSNNEIVNRDGNAALLSLVKAFDSVLAVYEGFCNLRQVDLKLKICRGSSVQKILVREAKSYFASQLVVGTSRSHHPIRSSASVAKYCAKKLGKDSSVLAVNNGKIVFHKEVSSSTRFSVKEVEDRRRSGLIRVIQRSLSKNTRAITDGSVSKELVKYHQGSNGSYDLTLGDLSPVCENNAIKECCPICSPVLLSQYDSNDETKMAIVPVEKIEAAPSSVSLLIRELPEVRPGWPLLRRDIMSNKLPSNRSSVNRISAVQWALQLPSRQFMPKGNSNEKGEVDDQDNDKSSPLDAHSGAIVPVGNETLSAPFSPKSASNALPTELEGLHEKYSAICRLFTYQELLSATSKFIPDNLIGKGGSSKVYKGYLPDGKELAVKILNSSEDAVKEFVMEVEIITGLHHKNIISLFGYSYEDNHLLLVYDFLPKGSLEDNLHGNKKDPTAFGWNQRYKVALGIAEALEYLHTRDDQPVIHRDVKSSNVLLSEDFEPQLCDFGLAKWAPTTSNSITCSDVAGTFGYLAPEYFMHGKVNEKIDVYAFGVVLLELITGRKPISNDHPKGQESLVMWAKPILNGGKFSQLVDPRLGSDYDQEQLERAVLTAGLCIRRAAKARPQMSLVVKLLHGDAEVTEWARLQLYPPAESDTMMPIDTLEGCDDDLFSQSNLQSHLNLALLGIEDSLSQSSIEQSISLEDYLRGRWSRSSSFD